MNNYLFILQIQGARYAHRHQLGICHIKPPWHIYLAMACQLGCKMAGIQAFSILDRLPRHMRCTITLSGILAWAIIYRAWNLGKSCGAYDHLHKINASVLHPEERQWPLLSIKATFRHWIIVRSEFQRPWVSSSEKSKAISSFMIYADATALPWRWPLTDFSTGMFELHPSWPLLTRSAGPIYMEKLPLCGFWGVRSRVGGQLPVLLEDAGSVISTSWLEILFCRQGRSHGASEAGPTLKMAIQAGLTNISAPLSGSEKGSSGAGSPHSSRKQSNKAAQTMGKCHWVQWPKGCPTSLSSTKDCAIWKLIRGCRSLPPRSAPSPRCCLIQILFQYSNFDELCRPAAPWRLE